MNGINKKEKSMNLIILIFLGLLGIGMVKLLLEFAILKNKINKE